MISVLSTIFAAIAGILFLINIIIMAGLVVIVGLIRLVIPVKPISHLLECLQEGIVALWIDFNSLLITFSGRVTWDIRGEGSLSPRKWYFVFANHQTWADILVMQKVFNRKIPLLKFFLKRELLWSLPMGGLACWMLGFPFMKRYSKAYLKKHPDQKNKDIETVRDACVQFKARPTTIMNFLEGTRFTAEKQRDRSSPYQHLLRPKSGGVAFVISELRDYIHEVIDVTIIYEGSEPSFWHFISGKNPKVTVYYKVIPLQPNHYGDYYNDAVYRKAFQSWINDLWKQKDTLIGKTLSHE